MNAGRRGALVQIGATATACAVRVLLEEAAEARRCGDRSAAEALETDAVMMLRAGAIPRQAAA